MSQEKYDDLLEGQTITIRTKDNRTITGPLLQKYRTPEHTLNASILVGKNKHDTRDIEVGVIIFK